jgi:hypothetical protein
LAAAVDRIDFCDASQQPSVEGRYHCTLLRDLNGVKTFRYSLNSKDPVLDKFVGLSGGFNPTGLGLKEEVGRDLRGRYRFMQSYPFEKPERFHPFTRYVAHPTFDAMLQDAGILKR